MDIHDIHHMLIWNYNELYLTLPLQYNIMIHPSHVSFGVLPISSLKWPGHLWPKWDPSWSPYPGGRLGQMIINSQVPAGRGYVSVPWRVIFKDLKFLYPENDLKEPSRKHKQNKIRTDSDTLDESSWNNFKKTKEEWRNEVSFQQP